MINHYNNAEMELVIFLKKIGVRVIVLSQAFNISEQRIYSWNKKIETEISTSSFKSYLATEVMPKLLEKKEAVDNLIEELKNIIDS